VTDILLFAALAFLVIIVVLVVMLLKKSAPTDAVSISTGADRTGCQGGSCPES